MSTPHHIEHDTVFAERRMARVAALLEVFGRAVASDYAACGRQENVLIHMGVVDLLDDAQTDLLAIQQENERAAMHRRPKLEAPAGN